MKTRARTGRFLEITLAGIVAVIIIVGIRIFWFQTFLVPTRSMEPTIHARDEIIISKIVFRTPVLNRLRMKALKRGDVIVFRIPERSTSYIVKRVVGLSGEQVSIRDAAVYIDGNRLAESYISNWDVSEPFRTNVPNGSVFVMGDNRMVSEDSRHYGAIPVTNVVGKARAVFAPLEHASFINSPHQKRIQQETP